eukprot:972089-Alexandrium_andersonii.AAC.1
MRIAHRTHQPLHEFIFWTAKAMDADVVDAVGLHISQLATGKAKDFFRKFTAMASDLNWLMELVDDVAVVS